MIATETETNSLNLVF